MLRKLLFFRYLINKMLENFNNFILYNNNNNNNNNNLSIYIYNNLSIIYNNT